MVTSSLPDPDPGALERSRLLCTLISDEIERCDGAIGFDQFMQLALFEPELGYYAAESPIFGPSGDFVTAPESGELFAQCLVGQCLDVLSEIGGSVLEYGAGSGRLACSLLENLRKHNALPEQYVIVEPSAVMRARQRTLIEQSAPYFIDRMRWYGEQPQGEFIGFVVANEMLDAMPIKRFIVQQGTIKELGVGLVDEHFGWHVMDTAVTAFPTNESAYEWHELPDNYISEVNPSLEEWLRKLHGVLRKGVVLIIDYGYPRHEYLHESRSQGTLKCHYQHRVHADPFFYPGLQDITAAVEFTTVAETANRVGFELAGFAAQTRFLIACGLEEIIAAQTSDDPALCYEHAQEAKLLLLPSEMGQTCKVIALATNYERQLHRFDDDERHRLRGFAGA